MRAMDADEALLQSPIMENVESPASMPLWNAWRCLKELSIIGRGLQQVLTCAPFHAAGSVAPCCRRASAAADERLEALRFLRPAACG
jgi:hypothetical protein